MRDQIPVSEVTTAFLSLEINISTAVNTAAQSQVPFLSIWEPRHHEQDLLVCFFRYTHPFLKYVFIYLKVRIIEKE